MSTGFNSIERLAYWQGQELRARDFRDQTESLEQLRRWHNRAAHQVYGVSQGLTVTTETPGTANVSCGLAYDCSGRALMLSADSSIAVPAITLPTDGPRYLVIAYSNGAPSLTFVSFIEFRASRGVPLARFKRGTPYTLDDTFRAPAARALSRPRLGAGSTVPGNTPWEKLPDDAGLQVVIDTSSAGFTKPPFYLASLIWEIENTKFSLPITSITDFSESDFTLQLLLKDVGQELFGVVAGAGLVNSVDAANVRVEFRKKIQFAPGEDFQQDDEVARLAPRADLALPITGKAVGTLTLGATSNDFDPGVGDVVVLGSLPAMATVQEPLTAISVADASSFHAGSAVFRMAGTTTGAAATVRATTGDTLLLATPLAGFNPGEKLGIVAHAGKVTLKNSAGTEVFLDKPTDQLTGAIVIRLSSQMDQEIPTTVISVNADKSITLTASIGLKGGDELGVANQVTTAGNSAPATALTVDNTAPFRAGDLIGVGSSPRTNNSVLKKVDGSNLILAYLITAAKNDPVINAQFSGRTFVQSVFTQFAFIVSNFSLFVADPVVAHLEGTDVKEASQVSGIFPHFNAIVVASPMPSVATGTVLAAARFNRTGIVKNPGSGTGPVAVQMQTAAEASLFRSGDFVTPIHAAGPLILAVVDQVSGDTVTIRTAIAGLAIGDTLGVVSLDAVAIVTDVPAGGNRITIDQADYARVGGVVARFTGWSDASAPVRITSSGVSATLDALPDGLITGDAIGFAALTRNQPKIRFDASARIRSQIVNVQGPDEMTGQVVDTSALIAAVNNQLATLQFIGVGSFTLRPEDVQITGSSQIDDFLAYAQQQRLSVSWLGCQIPLATTPTCPGVILDPCPCK